MKQIQTVKSPRHPRPGPLDLRTPTGKILPY